MRSNPGQPPRQAPPTFNKHFLPPSPSTPLDIPVFPISSRPAGSGTTPSHLGKIQPANFHEAVPPPEMDNPTFRPQVYPMFSREDGSSGLGQELRAVRDSNRFRWYNDEHDDYFGPPSGTSDKSLRPYAVTVDPRLYSTQAAQRTHNPAPQLSRREDPLPHSLNPYFLRPNPWPLKPAGGKVTFDPSQPGIEGQHVTPYRLLYAPRSSKYTGTPTGPSITFATGSIGFPPSILNLVYNEQSGTISHHDDPLFTSGPRKATMTIVHELPNLGGITQEIAKYHRDGRSLSREELAKQIAKCLWEVYIKFQKQAGCCREREGSGPYIPPVKIPTACDPWKLQYVRPRIIHLMGLNCYGDEWVSVFATEVPAHW